MVHLKLSEEVYSFLEFIPPFKICVLLDLCRLELKESLFKVPH